MRKITYLLFMVLLAAMLQAAGLESLSVDFGREGDQVQSGYEEYTGADKDLTSFQTLPYSAFGTTVDVTASWEDDAIDYVARMVDRGAQASYEDATEDLMREWIGSDVQHVGDPLTLTISGLPAGEYTWVSYHTDTQATAPVGSDIDITVNDAAGSATTYGFSCTNATATTFEDIAKFEATIISNGIDDVTIVFDNQQPDGSGAYNDKYFVMNGFDLTFNFIRGAATDPVPGAGDLEVDSLTTDEVSWAAPVDPNIVSIDGYDITYYILDNEDVTNDDPNFFTKGTTVGSVTSPYSISITYDQTMFWRIDTHLVWDDVGVTGVVNDTIEGYEWYFATLSSAPVVDLGSDVLTAMELLSAGLTGTVSSNNTITSITWEVMGNAANAAMQMYERTSLANLAQITDDPNLLIDWIGTDTRSLGDPMVLTLKDLPADTYSWTSYHHDADDNPVMGMFDVTVIDATGSTLIANNQITDSNETPVLFTTSFTSDGIDDVILVFDQQPYVDQGYNDAWFVMNGFELDTTGGSVDPLYIDFGVVDGPLMPGYQAYEAQHEVAASFTEQSYSAFGKTVSILPTWGGLATVTDTTNDPSSETQSADLDTDWPGEYTVQLSATDSADQTGSDTVVVTVAADACAAAQLSTSWDDFNIVDFNEDCVVNLEDFAGIAGEWLDDRNLAQE